MNEAAIETSPSRKVGMPLLIGIVLLPFVFAWFLLRRGYSSLARTIGFGWLALVVLVAFVAPAPPPARDTLATTQKGEPQGAKQKPEIPAVTSSELERAYAENEVAAQQKYGDRELAVSGTVARISLDILNQPMITFSSDKPVGPTATFDEDGSSEIAKVKPGQVVTARCEELGEVLGRPVLAECELVTAKGS